MWTEFIQKLLWDEYKDFDDVILLESPFIETTILGRDIRRIHIGITPRNFIVASDKMSVNENRKSYKSDCVDGTEMISLYPIEFINLSIHSVRNPCLKASFANNIIKYYELGAFKEKQTHWILWREKINFLSPQLNLNTHDKSYFEPYSALGLQEKRSFVIDDKKYFKIWNYNSDPSKKQARKKAWVDKHLYLGKVREIEDSLRPAPIPGLRNIISIEGHVSSH